MSLPIDLSVDLTTFLTLTAVAFVAGFIDAIAGGGGLLTVPALLTAGIPPHLVIGTNKLSATFGSATASYAFYKQNLFKPKLWINALIGTAIGALLGALVAQKISAEGLNHILPVAVFMCAIYLLFGKSPQKKSGHNCKIHTYRQWPQSLLLGFYDGIAGPGTGAFWSISTLLMYPVDLLRASGVARTMNFISNVCGLTIFILYGQIAWVLGISMGVFLMCGAFLGAKTAIKGDAKLIKPIFITVVLCLTVRLIWQNWL